MTKTGAGGGKGNFHDWRMVDRGEELGGLEEGGQSGRRLKDKRNGGKTG